MRIQIPSLFQTVKIEEMKKWHTWFAWYPVVIENKVVFLEYVERKGELNIADDIVFEYREQKQKGEQNA